MFLKIHKTFKYQETLFYDGHNNVAFSVVNVKLCT